MPSKKATTPKYVTNDVFKKEIKRLDKKIDGVEKRLDAKIDSVEKHLDAKIDSKVDAAVQSMKDYTDSRFNQLDLKLNDFQQNIFRKLDMSERGIMKMLENIYDTQVKFAEKVEDHEQRIIRLEKHAEL